MKLCPKCQKQFSDDANFCPVDAARLVPLESQAAATDSIAARFDLGERLGGGRTGAVHRASEKATGQAAAVKIIAPSVVALPGLAQRLERELKQLERVQSSGVAKVLASGKRGDDPWLALELLDGAQTLAEAIAARGPIALDQAAHLIEVVGEALIEAAQVGVVHRDLAPKNILFAGDEIKLINFSLPVPTSDKVPGVAEFVAPEQQDGKPVDQRSNLYSLGALYYYVLTGQPVQTEPGGGVTPPSALATVPPALDAVIMRALDRSPSKRFLTVRQFLDEVGRLARSEPAAGAAPQGPRPAKPRAELVQTLLGVRVGGLQAAIAAASPGAASAPVGSVVPTTVVGVAPPSGPLPSDTAATLVDSVFPLEPSAPAPSAIPTTMPGVALPAVVAAAERSPWAAPAASPAPPVSPVPQSHAAIGAALEPAVAVAPVAPIASDAPTLPPAGAAPAAAPAAATVPAAPVVPAPLLAAPILAPSTGKPAKGDDGSKGKFRETLWFKKGELDAQAAELAAAERAKTGKDVARDKSDSLPIDERYKDDGTLSRSDKEKYSLRTGATSMTQAVREPSAGASAKVSEEALIGELKRGRRKVLALIAVAVVAIAALIVAIVS